MLVYALVGVPALHGQVDAEFACIEKCPMVRGAFGTSQHDPACVRRCLVGEAPATPTSPARRTREPEVAPIAATASAIRFTKKVWDTNPTYRPQKAVIERHIRRFVAPGARNAALLKEVQRWTIANVEFDRQSTRSSIRANEMYMGRDKLIFDDRFFTADRNRQTNLLFFELGKVIWQRAMDVLESRVPADDAARASARRIQALTSEHYGPFTRLKFAKFNNSDLGDVVDPDSPSAFGHAFRALALDLQLPGARNGERTTWIRTRRELERALGILIRPGR